MTGLSSPPTPIPRREDGPADPGGRSAGQRGPAEAQAGAGDLRGHPAGEEPM